LGILQQSAPPTVKGRVCRVLPTPVRKSTGFATRLVPQWRQFHSLGHYEDRWPTTRPNFASAVKNGAAALATIHGPQRCSEGYFTGMVDQGEAHTQFDKGMRGFYLRQRHQGQ
jgi:hypothetical protein